MIRVAVGDVDGDGMADVVAGGGQGGGPRVSVFAGAGLLADQRNRIADFFAGDPDGRSGVRLAVKDLDGDRQADVLAGSGTTSRVIRYTGAAIMAEPAEPDRLDELVVVGDTGGVTSGSPRAFPLVAPPSRNCRTARPGRPPGRP